MIKCDVHVHSIGSYRIIPANSATAHYGIFESYVDAEYQYQLAKSRGMDLVTLSDHNSISEAKKLVELHPEDTFMSCEYEVKGEPGYQDREVLVLYLDEKLHDELMIARLYGDKEFSKIVKQEKKPHSWAHPGYPVNPKGPRLTIRDLKLGREYYDAVEKKNGDGMRINEIGEMLSDSWGMTGTGGSDDHAGLFTGLTYTVGVEANSREEFFQHFLEGKVSAAGEDGSLDKSYQTMLAIGRQFIGTERAKRGEMGFINYFRKDPVKAIELVFIPYVLPFFLKVSARKYQGSLERRTSELEKKFSEHRKKEHKEELKEYVRELKSKQDKEMEKIKSTIRDRSYYFPKHTLFERIINWVLKNNRSVQNDFDCI